MRIGIIGAGHIGGTLAGLGIILTSVVLITGIAPRKKGAVQRE